MRLHWPFRRPIPDGDAAATPLAARAGSRVEVPVRRDWRDAGSLRPTFVGDPGIRVQRFPVEIAGSRLPAPILGPLGHARGADGPAGLVSGIARPTLAPVTEGPDAGPGLRLRATRHGRPASGADGTDAPAVATPTAGIPLAGDGELAVTAPARDPLPAWEPRRLPAAPASTPERPTVRLTVARTPDLVLAAEGRGGGDARGTQRGPVRSDAGPAPIATIPRAPAGASSRTILRTSRGPRTRIGAPILQGDASVPSLDLPPVGDRSRSRSSTVVAPVPEPAGEGGRPAPVADAASDAPLVGGLSSAVADATSTARVGRPAASPSVPRGLVLSRAASSAAVGGPTGQHDPAIVGQSGPPRRTGPLAGAVPITTTPGGLRPTIPPTQDGPTGSPDGRTGVSSGDRRMAQRSASGPGLDPSARRLEGPSHGPVAGGRASTSTTLAAPLGVRPDGDVAHAAVARPGVSQATVTRSSVPTRAIGPIGAPVLQLARPAPPAVAPAAHERSHLGAPAPRGAAGPTAVGQPLTLLRATDDATGVTMGEVRPSMGPDREGPGMPMVAGAAAASAQGATAMADRDIDEMVRRIYPRLRRSLTSELLVARERAGTLADVR